MFDQNKAQCQIMYFTCKIYIIWHVKYTLSGTELCFGQTSCMHAKIARVRDSGGGGGSAGSAISTESH